MKATIAGIFRGNSVRAASIEVTDNKTATFVIRHEDFTIKDLVRIAPNTWKITLVNEEGEIERGTFYVD